MNNSSNSQKKAILQEFIAEDDIYICVNAKNDRVVVPNNHKGNIDLRLVLSLNFVNKPSFESDCIEVVLRFGGVPRKCILPYEAIWGVFNNDLNRLFFWQEHMPEEVAMKIQEFQKEQGKKTGTFTPKKAGIQKKTETRFGAQEETEKTEPKEEKKPVLTVIENKTGKTTEKKPSKGRSRAHLKVLK